MRAGRCGLSEAVHDLRFSEWATVPFAACRHALTRIVRLDVFGKGEKRIKLRCIQIQKW